MKTIYISLAFFCISFSCFSQDLSMRDTLRHSIVVADKHGARETGARIVSIPKLGTIVSATGETDVIKYIQTLPGVSTGAEGSSAIYVRGGNIGNNVITLDGVRLYGGSHLLGMTSAYSQDILSSALFRNGGFTSEEHNITASHISLTSIDGSFAEKHWKASISNFLISGMMSTPLIKDKVSLVVSGRVSPIGLEYSAAQSIIGGALDSLSNVRTVVADGFAKVKWIVNPRHNISFSMFGSIDNYGYCYGKDSDEHMGWSNFIANISHEGATERGWFVSDGLSYNRFASSQGIIKTMGGTLNNLAIVSSLDELCARTHLTKSYSNGNSIHMDLNTRYAVFNPGTSSTFSGGTFFKLDSPRTDNISHSMTTSASFQWEKTRDDKYEFRSSLKANINASDADPGRKYSWHVNPEADLCARLYLAPWLGIEGTADWTAQYYHTLEGVPLGWSLDMIVPTDSRRKPEKAQQFYSAVFARLGSHRLSLGVYDKKMHNLVYFIDASQLFSSAIAGWRDNIAVGEGTSRGIELLYEKSDERLNYKIAYTLSKTDRTFAAVNNGKSFPAKFDRRHVLNANLSYIITNDDKKETGISGLFTWQSGHWETVAAGEYYVSFLFGNRPVNIDYFSGTNNFKMKDYLRLDLGYYIRLKANHHQTFNFGIYNVLNRHNPFTITYDSKSREWRKISLFPIMPSISYSISL